MNIKLHEQVGVGWSTDSDTKKIRLHWMKWKGKIYKIINQTYDKKHKDSRFIDHVFFVYTDAMSFRLRFNSESLRWTLEGATDGNAD